MKKSFVLLAGILVCAFLISCQKENSSEIATAPSLAGTYKFVSMNVNGVSSSSTTFGPDVERAVTVTKYLTKNNSGTVTFTPTTMSSNNLSYDIDTVLEVSFYRNGVFEDKLEMPFQFSVPPTSATSSYKVITSDSLYFSAGSMFRDNSVTQPTEASGARIKREGDKLLMTVHVNKTTTQNSQGMLITTSNNAVSIITLQKL